LKVFSCPSFSIPFPPESHKENWKYSFVVYNSTTASANLTKRIERKVAKALIVNSGGNLTKRIESFTPQSTGRVFIVGISQRELKAYEGEVAEGGVSMNLTKRIERYSISFVYHWGIWWISQRELKVRLRVLCKKATFQNLTKRIESLQPCT